MRTITKSLIAIALFLVVGCMQANDKNNPVKLSLDESMAIFNPSGSQQFGLPSVFVIDNAKGCIAAASNREIYGDSFLDQIEKRSPVCSEVNLPKVESRTSIEFAPDNALTFLVLIDSGDYCTACGDIISEFESRVLRPLGNANKVIWIDIGMTEWFSASR